MFLAQKCLLPRLPMTLRSNCLVRNDVKTDFILWYDWNARQVCKNIRIFNGCEVQIEDSVMKITVRHPEWQNFQFPPNNYYGFLSLHTFPSTIVFTLEYALLYQFYADINAFSVMKCSYKSMMSWHHARARLTPRGIRWKYPEPVKIAENLVGYARNVSPTSGCSS